MAKVPRFIPDVPKSTDANELSSWLHEYFSPFSKNIRKINLNKELIAEAVRTMFWHRDSAVISKYNAGFLVETVDREDWEALPRALESFDVTWS